MGLPAFYLERRRLCSASAITAVASQTIGRERSGVRDVTGSLLVMVVGDGMRSR